MRFVFKIILISVEGKEDVLLGGICDDLGKRF